MSLEYIANTRDMPLDFAALLKKRLQGMEDWIQVIPSATADRIALRFSDSAVRNMWPEDAAIQLCPDSVYIVFHHGAAMLRERLLRLVADEASAVGVELLLEEQ